MPDIQEYLDAGARLMRVIDSEPSAATIFRPGRGSIAIGDDGVRDGEDQLPGRASRPRDGFTVPRCLPDPAATALRTGAGWRSARSSGRTAP